jgi:hypothetical protein
MSKQHPFIYSTFPETLEAPHEKMAVSELKKVIAAKVQHFKMEYALIEETRGDHPDRELADTDTVEIKHEPHFYSQPPATFGG